MITVNTAFGNLDPLTTYLDVLEWVTDEPSEGGLAMLMETDKILTDRAVLFPKQGYVSGEGWRTFGYEPCMVSGGVEAVAQSMLQASVSLRSDRGDGLDALQAEEAISRRRRAARAALISLGGKLALSGAFIERDIQPAYEAIRDSMDVIGDRDPAFSDFGLGRIRSDLLREYHIIQREPAMRNPIGKAEAKRNVKSAWRVVGRPYGMFTNLVVALSA